MSVRPSIRPSVGPLVRDAFVKIAENGVMLDGDASYVVYTALLKLYMIHKLNSFPYSAKLTSDFSHFLFLSSE